MRGGRTVGLVFTPPRHPPLPSGSRLPALPGQLRRRPLRVPAARRRLLPRPSEDGVAGGAGVEGGQRGGWPGLDWPGGVGWQQQDGSRTLAPPRLAPTKQTHHLSSACLAGLRDVQHPPLDADGPRRGAGPAGQGGRAAWAGGRVGLRASSIPSAPRRPPCQSPRHRPTAPADLPPPRSVHPTCRRSGTTPERRRAPSWRRSPR